ncbi:MAG: peptide chain release factor N(5)-glutamine methyltransferase [Algicola sp.]|nr:peptide chain release factor N(5)-glutamine methyltransferase [Algicola sp.]
MRLRTILDIYHKELDALYGKQEVDSFFNLLIDHYLQLKRIHIVVDPEYVITKSEEQPLFEALSALKLEQPIQYIIGVTDFYGLTFKVNTHTLIPRPETEELVSWILSDQKGNESVDPLQIMDIGTGSGCIAITLAKKLTNARVIGMDISEKALELSRENAISNMVDLSFLQGDILNVTRSDHLLNHKLDVVVSNPPYVRHLEKAEMQNNVLNNEPHTALFVSDDNPLIFYKAIGEFAKDKLKPNGLLYFEINEYLGRETMTLLEQQGFKNIKLKQDMFGKDRMIRAEK